MVASNINMPVISPYLLIVARYNNSTVEAVAHNPAKNERRCAIYLGLVITALILILAFPFAYRVGDPWYKNDQAATIARQEVNADGLVCHQSFQLAHRETCLVVAYSETSTVLGHETNAVLFFYAAPAKEPFPSLKVLCLPPVKSITGARGSSSGLLVQPVAEEVSTSDESVQPAAETQILSDPSSTLP
jgi:hypothetical protein